MPGTDSGGAASTFTAPSRRESDAHVGDRRLLWVCWVLTRIVAVVVLYAFEKQVLGDLLFFDKGLGGADPIEAAPAYPLPGLASMALPWLLAEALGGVQVYLIVAPMVWLAVDGVFTGFLARRSLTGAWYWLVGVTLLGPVAYTRFDLMPGVLLAAAMLLLQSRPRLAGVLTATAVAVKLWPILVVPAIVAASRRRGSFLVPFAVTGLAFALASLVVGGWDRTLAPLRVQQGRGLEIESVAALPVVIARHLDPDRWDFDYGFALEVTGPGVPFALAVASAATLLLIAAALLCVWGATRAGVATTPAVHVWLVLAPLATYVVVSPVLSPQYFLWLLAATAASLCLVDDRALRRWAVGLLVLTLLTHVVYPWGFVALDAPRSPTWAVTVLTVRNVALVVLVVAAWASLANAWRQALKVVP